MLWTTCMPRPWTLSACLSLSFRRFTGCSRADWNLYTSENSPLASACTRDIALDLIFVNFLPPRSRSSSNDTLESSLDFPNIPDISPMQIEIVDRGKVTRVTSSLNLKPCSRETESTRWPIKICPSAARQWKIAQNHASRNANRRSPARLGTN